MEGEFSILNNIESHVIKQVARPPLLYGENFCKSSGRLRLPKFSWAEPVDQFRDISAMIHTCDE